MQWKGKYCSNKCATVAQGHKGPTKWSYARKNAKIARKCEFCKTEFVTPYSNKRYCSKECLLSAGKDRAIKRGKGKRYTLKAKQHEEWVETRSVLLKNQDSKCAICKIALGTQKRANLDHCHKTGQIRGVLCTQCNHALGLLNDSVETFKSAIKYLEDHE
jgi:hypothetical protein